MVRVLRINVGKSADPISKDVLLQKLAGAVVLGMWCASSAAASPMRIRTPRTRHKNGRGRGRHVNDFGSNDNRDASEAMGFINFMNNPSLSQNLYILYIVLEDNMNPGKILDGSKMLHRGNKILTAFRRIFGIRSR